MIGPNAAHGAFVRETADQLARWYREGNTTELEAMRERHRAFGYGQLVVHEEATVRCVCGMVLRDDEWASHVAAAADENSMHRHMCRESSIDIDTPARAA